MKNESNTFYKCTATFQTHYSYTVTSKHLQHAHKYYCSKISSRDGTSPVVLRLARSGHAPQTMADKGKSTLRQCTAHIQYVCMPYIDQLSTAVTQTFTDLHGVNFCHGAVVCQKIKARQYRHEVSVPGMR
jgi:hypothetical protein